MPASAFNPLLPSYSDYLWDNYTPEFASVMGDSHYFRFTAQSVDRDIATLSLYLYPFCCSSTTTQACGSDSDNPGNLFLNISVDESLRRMIKTTNSACGVYHSDSTVSCISPFQVSQCGELYSAVVPMIDFMSVLLSWFSKAENKEGDIESTILYDFIVNGTNPCELTTPSFEYGKATSTSVS